MALNRFNDGDPVDITKLNEIIDEITSVNKNLNLLGNQTVSFRPVIWAGKGTVTLGDKAGSVVEEPINYAKAEFGTIIPSVTVTPRSSLKGAVPCFLKTGMTSSSANVAFVTVAGMEKKKVYFDWIAVAMVANS